MSIKTLKPISTTLAMLFAAWLLTVGCAVPASRGGTGHLAGATPTLTTPPRDPNPTVFVLAAGMPCESPSEHRTQVAAPSSQAESIVDLTAREKTYFESSGIKFRTASTNVNNLKREIESAAKAGALRRGLLLYYTGHAVVRQAFALGAAPQEKHEPETHLCLENGHALAMHDIIDWLENQPRDLLPWAVLVLDACESAYVHLEGRTLPIAVLAASPEPVATGEQVGPFARAFAAVLSRPEQHDSNGDGMVTDRELLEAINSEMAVAVPSAVAGVPRPRLQRQASSSLPVRFHDGPVKTGAEIAAAAESLLRSNSVAERALGQALADQLALRNRASLPRLDWDLLVTTESLPTTSCQRLRDVADEHASCFAGRPDLRQLEGNWADVAPAIARFSTAFDVYRIDAVKGWARWFDVIRLRDGHLMTSTRKSPAQAIPARHSVLARTVDGSDWLVRVTGSLGPTERDCGGLTPDSCELMSRRRSFTVCEEEEGQCFVASK